MTNTNLNKHFITWCRYTLTALEEQLLIIHFWSLNYYAIITWECFLYVIGLYETNIFILVGTANEIAYATWLKLVIMAHSS